MVLSGEIQMGGKPKNNSDFYRHLFTAIYANIITAALLAGLYFFEKPLSKAVAFVGLMILWGGLPRLVRQFTKREWGLLKTVGYHFVLTWPFFWALDERRRRRHAEAEAAELKTIIDGSPRAKIIEQTINPVTRKDGFESLLSQMDYMPDRDLAQIIGSIRYYAGDILKLAENGENYTLFRQLIEKLSSYDIDGHTQTFESLLWILSDIYQMEPPSDLRRQIQKDMIGPLKNVLCRADEAHVNAIRRVIENIMLDSKDDHDLARPILETLLTLDPKAQKPSWQVVFDQCIKRAFRFPESFGFDFIHILSELKHKVFWLDFHALRDIWMQPPTPGRKRLIDSNQAKFDELCSKVFAAVEEPQNSGNRHGRVFRRVKADNGKAKVECVTPDGTTCQCQGESLSFRGVYSGKCARNAAERLQAKITPILEVNRQFKLSASVAKVHKDERGNEVSGRGIFFEDAKEDVAKSLYEYVSQR
jgi:hypothetical protein